MDNPITPLETETVEARLSSIEKVLKIEERLSSIENIVSLRAVSLTPQLPWWKRGIPVGLILALIAAIPASITAVDGYFKNKGDIARTRLESQEKIRQTYLDRALKTDLTEIERLRVYNLLIKLNNDPELKEWASEERQKAYILVEDLKAQKEAAEKSYAETAVKIEQLKKTLGLSVGTIQKDYNKKLSELENKASQAKAKAEALSPRVGDSPSNFLSYDPSSGTFKFSSSKIDFPTLSGIDTRQVSLSFVDTEKNPIPGIQFILSSMSGISDSFGRSVMRIPRLETPRILITDTRYTLVSPRDGILPSLGIDAPFTFLNEIVCRNSRFAHFKLRFRNWC